MIATLLRDEHLGFREIYFIKVYCADSEKTTVIFSNILFCKYLFLILYAIFIHFNYNVLTQHSRYFEI